MRTRGEYSISKRLTLMNMLVSGAALLLACAGLFLYDRVTFEEAMVSNLSIQSQIVGANSVSALVFNDSAAAEGTLAALRASPSISAAAIYTPDRKPLAGYSRGSVGRIPPLPAISVDQAETHSFYGDRITLARRIVAEGEQVGFVYIESDLKELDDRFKRYAEIVVATLGVSLLVALMVSWLAKRAISEPITQLAGVATRVSRDKNYALRATASTQSREVSMLIGAFNQMLTQIQERDAALQSAREELEFRVQERTSQLLAANKELEAFSYSISHDLRAPLRHIDGFSMILNQKYAHAMAPEAQQYLRRVRDGAKRMGQLVDDFLNVARIGRHELVVKPVDPNELIRDAVYELRSEYEGRWMEWRIADLPMLEADRGLMKIVFTNLISNAVKYTGRKERAVINIALVVQNDAPVIVIRDNGAGFEPEYSHKLFGVFQRLHRAEEFEGNGVGLATVQRIIHKHGGQIWARGEVDKGAAFFFTVVLAKEAARTQRTPDWVEVKV